MNTILDTIAKDIEKINAIESQLFNVVKVPLITGRDQYETPDAFGIYKENGGAALGVVGKNFEPAQPKLLFDQFVSGIRNNENLSIDGLKFVEMREGSKIRFVAPVGKVGFKNKFGSWDESEIYLNFQMGFDGKTKNSMYLSTLRLICTNGMKKSFTELECQTFKNTKGNSGKAFSLIADIQRQLKQVETIDEMYLAMNKVEIKQADINAYIQKVTGFKLDEVKVNSKADKIVNAMLESIELEISRTGATAFGLFNGITHYTNHVASSNPEYIFLDSGLKTNDKALKFALELIEA